ncbi:tyrosine-type recombinase/integrase [Amaricoccus sp. W119]|uniref:tyrosine-type recombinase/integrase n=1 Tax=Amaricoccus sp. W119 TaxID=3391833 RepID=UPI0039A51152
MSYVRLRGVKKVKKRLASGAILEIHYAFIGGPVIWRSDSAYAVGSPPYLAAYEKAHGIEDASAPAKLTVRDMMRRFSETPGYKALSPSYQRDLRWAFGKIDEKFGTAPAAVFDRPEIRKMVRDWRGQFKPRDADRARQALTKLVKWAIEEDILTVNRISGMKSAYAADRHELIWVDDEIEAAVKLASPEVAAAIVLWSETGMRPGDLCRATSADILPCGKLLRVRTSKRGRWAIIPISDAAAAVIDARPEGQAHLIRPARAASWSRDHLSKSIKAAARAAKIREELHPYDLRGSAVTRLVLAGVGVADLALIMGWKSETAAKMIGIYASLDPRRAEGVRVEMNRKKAAGLRLVVG